MGQRKFLSPDKRVNGFVISRLGEIIANCREPRLVFRRECHYYIARATHPRARSRGLA